MRRKYGAVVGMAVGLIVGLATLAQADPLTIRVGWVQTPGHLAPLIEALGKRASRNLQASRPELRDAGDALQRHDAANPGAGDQRTGDRLAGDRARWPWRSPTRISTSAIVADVVAGRASRAISREYFVVKADGPIKKIEDVKGKRIATNTIGSASDSAMRTMFRKHGIKDSDFTTVETNFANMPAMLEGGKVDMIGVLPQFAKGIVDNAKYKVLFTARDAVGPTQAVMWAMRADVIAAHRPVIGRFLRGPYPRRALVPRPDEPRGGASTSAAEVTKLPTEKLALRLHQGRFLPLARCAARNRARCRRRSTRRSNSRSLPKRVEISPKYVDLSLIEEAKKRGSTGNERQRRWTGRRTDIVDRPGQPHIPAGARPPGAGARQRVARRSATASSSRCWARAAAARARCFTWSAGFCRSRRARSWSRTSRSPGPAPTAASSFSISRCSRGRR